MAEDLRGCAARRGRASWPFTTTCCAGGSRAGMGLADWRSAQRRLLATGADVILCGHDHHEGAGQIEGALAVSTSGTHSFRARGGRPSVFNLVTIDDRAVHIQHFRWESRRAAASCTPTRHVRFARRGPPRWRSRWREGIREL